MPIQSSSLLTGGSSSGISLRSLDQQLGSFRQSILPKSYDWLKDQDYDPLRFSSAYSSTRPGTLGGGFTFPQMASLATNRAITPDPPRPTQSILNGKEGGANQKVGQFSIREVAPFDMLAELTGSFLGNEQPMIGENGSWFDPYAFAEDKQVDFNNAPSRLADYLVNSVRLPFFIADIITGAPMPTTQPKDQMYKFQESRNYWPFVTQATDEELEALAIQVVDERGDPVAERYQVDRLLTQFKIDRNKQTALTSGLDSTDYFAKKGMTWLTQQGRATISENPGGTYAQSMGYQYDGTGKRLANGMPPGFSVIPFLSHAWASTANPLTKQDEEIWARATPQQRASMLGATGTAQMVYQAPMFLVGLAGMGSVAGSIAAGVKGTATLGGKALQIYNTALNLSKGSMALGVTSATALWGAAAAFPDNEFIQELTLRMDRSRPVSESHFAGVVNAMGMFSSGTFGINTAVRMNARVAVMAGAKLPVGLQTISRGALGGMPNLRTYEYGFGGSRMADFMVDKIGLPLHEVKVGVQRTFLSYTLNTLRRMNDEGWAAMLENPAGTPLAGMTTEQILELQAMQASRSLETVINQAEGIMRTMAKAREEQPLGLWDLGDDIVRGFKIAVRNARSWDDGMARAFINDYGSPFISRLTGSDSGEAMRAWMAKKITSLGYSADALPAAKAWGTEQWRQATRLVYQFDFNRWADTVNKAAGGAEEAARISIMSMRHLFRDEADRALVVLRGDDETAALAMLEKLKDKIEIETWDATEVRATVRRGPGTPLWEATPAKLADHIEDIRETLSVRRGLVDPADPTALDALNYVHAKMEEEGLWTIGFKPVNEAGDFVVSVQTRTGHIVESRWLDYPLDNKHLVDLGNRGYLSAKLDEVTRGFRTWRLLEFQKGSLFRALADRTDLTPTQIEMFHQGVMDLARKHNVSPQAVGRLPVFAPGLRSVSQEVNDLADRIFGGVVRDKNGKVVNWRREVGNAYRQSYRLNLTAGVTSHIKANFGPVGELVTYGSDAMYVMWRFVMSPLFKAGEIWESSQLNLMRRVYPGQDPYTMSLYVRYGAGGDPATIAVERMLDPFIAGMDSTVIGNAPGGIRAAIAPANARVLNGTSMAQEAAHRRAAQSLAFYARQLPEDQAQVIARTAMAEQAKRYRAVALGGEALRTNDRGRLLAELANSVDENGVMLAGTDQARLMTVLRQLNREDLDPTVAAALDAYPWGAPTDDQIRAAANMRARAEVLRDPVQYQKADGTLDADALMMTYRELIDEGIMPPDPALTLRDRYDELLEDLRAQRAQNKATPGLGPIRAGIDWTDPVTGQSVIRTAAYSAKSEFEHAVRSLAGRRKNVKVTVPTADEMAHRLGVAAEARLSPVPILRSDRVGPEGAIPADFTMDPAEVYVRGSTNRSNAMTPGGAQYDADGNLILSTAQEKEGVLDWLDLDNTMPEDRAIWHTTTNIDAVNDTGLYSRYELMERGTPPEAIAALKAAGDAGTPASEIRVTLRDGSSIGVNPPTYEALVAGHRKLLKDAWTNDEVPWESVETISNNTSGDVIWHNYSTAAAPRGLGAHGVDKLISTTTNRLHADTIAERLGFLSEVARDEVDGADIIRHFYNGYDELTGGDIASVYEMASALNLQQYVNATVDRLAEEQLARAIDRAARALPDPAQYLFDTTLTLDKHLHREMRSQLASNGEEGFTHGVILIINKEQAARIRPEQIGVVQVAVRRSKPTVLAPGSAELDAARDTVYEQIKSGSPLHGRRIEVVIQNESGGQYMIPVPWRAAESKAAWDYRWEQQVRNYTPGGPSGVLIRHEPVGGGPGDSWETIVVHGRGPGERAEPRVGPDQFELQAHSDDVFVIDRRIDAEPLATDADGLLRQLRQVSDENGNPIPGYERRYNQIVHDAGKLRDESLNPDPVSSMEDIASEPAGMTRNLRERVQDRFERGKGKGKEMGDEFFDPVPGKERKMDRLTIQMQREEFPRVIAGTGAETVFRDLGIPEQQQADFLVQDRALLERWQQTGDPDDFRAMIDHAGSPEDRAQLDAFYASEEWDVVSGLWRLNLRSASEEAFGVHFFDPYRSPLLRGMNHPVLGVYPAAWALKTAREWAKFLFDNQMFGVDLRLGMTPAVAVANITRSQQVAFAQQNPDYDGTMEEFMREGPLGSTIFIFNLLMPGDWSSLPFPLSRTLREILRNPNNINPADILAKNVAYLGVTRDMRLGWEAANEIKDLVFPPEPEPNVRRPKKWTSTPKRSTPKWYDVPTR